MQKKQLIKKLKKYSEESTKDLCWLEKETIEEAIKLGLVEIEKLNANQNDGTFKTIVALDNKRFVYVGEFLET